jgi:hypothetical protein
MDRDKATSRQSERLLTAREIADVLADMKAGRFLDPIFGRGFFCRSGNSLRVSAANAWRGAFFVPLSVEPRKKGSSVTDASAGNSAQTRGHVGLGNRASMTDLAVREVMRDQMSCPVNGGNPADFATDCQRIGEPEPANASPSAPAALEEEQE